MTATSELRAREYRELARQQTAIAEGSPLERAREVHAQAAARWTELAEEQERRTARDAVRAGPAATLPAEASEATLEHDPI
ncbi:MAG TPA: hypothetical protein VG248_05230 [Caulobacteraceae bacterium]|jgi:hypothetical protein|nr:hypothetical protein [Caulobacteraceae bacterium]